MRKMYRGNYWIYIVCNGVLLFYDPDLYMYSFVSYNVCGLVNSILENIGLDQYQTVYYRDFGWIWFAVI